MWRSSKELASTYNSSTRNGTMNATASLSQFLLRVTWRAREDSTMLKRIGLMPMATKMRRIVGYLAKVQVLQIL
jgi:hypothetical protein